ncbi:hypothetical protein [Paenibacillus sp. DCT19]|uniref:hypothetical protein n=1 Tax=Paenibacillus sp. DCT19 TaxID=2211212 RepID=UPI000FE1D37F|nr:hypothetical protein [Paenibacillus sp. DCT19]
MVARRKNGLYVWTVRLLVFVLVFGQFGVYGGTVHMQRAVRLYHLIRIIVMSSHGRATQSA